MENPVKNPILGIILIIPDHRDNKLSFPFSKNSTMQHNIIFPLYPHLVSHTTYLLTDPFLIKLLQLWGFMLERGEESESLNLTLFQLCMLYTVVWMDK